KKTLVAEVTAPEDQLSLAIGKDGQNVRLASKLTGYKIEIIGAPITEEEKIEKKEQVTKDTQK
ncbi:MAG TPA: transcription termination/antitermination protein NusA, partial [Patescibacteria group bacterium]|nr:transcription termination/antitermination protein NusA [Patescibacteria group bacterium]